MLDGIVAHFSFHWLVPPSSLIRSRIVTYDLRSDLGSTLGGFAVVQDLRVSLFTDAGANFCSFQVVADTPRLNVRYDELRNVAPGR